MALNLRNDRIYCNSCDCEVQIDNIPKWPNSIRNILIERRRLSNRSNEVNDVSLTNNTDKQQCNQQMDTIETVIIPKQQLTTLSVRFVFIIYVFIIIEEPIRVGREYRQQSVRATIKDIEDESDDISPRGLLY